MDLQKLYNSFVSLVDSLSADEMQRETERAVFESRDSYLMGEMDIFEEDTTLNKVSGSFSASASTAKTAKFIGGMIGSATVAKSAWRISDEERLIA